MNKFTAAETLEKAQDVVNNPDNFDGFVLFAYKETENGFDMHCIEHNISDRKVVIMCTDALERRHTNHHENILGNDGETEH